MSVALLSQGKKSEYGTAQPYTCIDDDNVMNERYARATATAESHTTKFGTNKQTNKQTDRKAGYRVAPQLKVK